jgi:hypothetical protein
MSLTPRQMRALLRLRKDLDDADRSGLLNVLREGIPPEPLDDADRSSLTMYLRRHIDHQDSIDTFLERIYTEAGRVPEVLESEREP